jgi:hypothetical protein
MATVPHASVTVDPTSGAPGGGDDVICILSPCVSLADFKARRYGSAAAIVADHGYCEGAEYAAMHIAQTGLPVLFAGMPIGTAGAVSRFSQHENTGTSVVSVAAGSDGVLAEHDGVVEVVAGGTIGTSQIKLNLSLDGGRSFQPIRLGTANSYVLPNVGVTVSFGAGTLVTGDTIASWFGSAPKITTADLASVRAQWAGSLDTFRSALLCSELPDSSAASSFITQLNAYATENDRHIYARGHVPDRLPQAAMSKPVARMTGAPALTFAEVGATGDTITRAAGSWLADGFVVGDTIVITGSGSNNITAVIASLSATVITLGSEDLVAEVTSAASIVGYVTLTFAEVGGTGDTLTRSRGSFLVDGFRVGDTVTVAGSVSNNVSGAVTGVTATVLTFGSTDLAAESLGASANVTVTTNLSKSAWMSAQDAAFASIDDEPRLDLSAGRSSEPSPYSGWLRRVPASWLASAREYQHDLHIPTWRKDLGPAGVGGGLFDSNGDLVEWDDRVDGGAGSAARFTTLRTWANGPRGTFVTLSLTRAGDGKIESLTHNQAVINAGCNTVQLATENVIGRTLQLNSDGTATKESLNVIQGEVNAQLDAALLASRGEGPRASSAVWTPAADDLYNVAEPVMNGVLRLLLNGTVHSVATRVRVQTNG